MQPHIRLDENLNIQNAIIVGDLARVDKIAKLLNSPKKLASNREFVSVCGDYKGKKILALSVGIGAPSAAIGVEELVKIGVKNIIRVGSCGSLQSDIKLGEIIIATSAVRDDGVSLNYAPLSFPATPDLELLIQAKSEVKDVHFGVIRSHDSFYFDENEQVEEFWSKKGVLAADMESSVLFVVGVLRGVKTLSILNSVVEYKSDVSEGINSLVDQDEILAASQSKSIKIALEILSKI